MIFLVVGASFGADDSIYTASLLVSRFLVTVLAAFVLPDSWVLPLVVFVFWTTGPSLFGFPRLPPKLRPPPVLVSLDVTTLGEFWNFSFS